MEPLPKTFSLTVQALHFGFAERAVFTNLNLKLASGITLIRGGDGRGKSSLLRLLAGTLEPTSGQICINECSATAQSVAYRAQVFWAEPRTEEFDQLTVLEYFAFQRKHLAQFDGDVLAEVVNGLALELHQHKQLFMLSTGSKRKVWLAAAFASGAAVTLLDEPFAALDGPSISFILTWLSQSALSTRRIWVIADYQAPPGPYLAQVVDLGD